MGPVFTVLSPVIVGALTGLGLSFIALSPLVIGGIVGSMVPALFTVYFVVNTFPDKEGAIFFSIATLASAAIGVGLAAAATAIFPGAIWSWISSFSRCNSRGNSTNSRSSCSSDYNVDN